MIHSVTVINYLGERAEIVLREEYPKHGLLVKGIDGLGPVKANVNTTKIATMDGGYFNSARTDNRNIVFHFILQDAPTIEEARYNCYKFFPVKQPIRLIIKTSNRYVETIGYVESNEPDIFSNMEEVQVSVICPDPYFYSFEEEFTGFDAYGTFNLRKEVFYDGDVDCGIDFTFKAQGATGRVEIWNDTTGVKMIIDQDAVSALTGSPIVSGDVVKLSTKRNMKSITVTRAETWNIINALGRNPNWITLTKGYNVIYIYFVNGLSTVYTDSEYTNMTFRHAYGGV